MDLMLRASESLQHAARLFSVSRLLHDMPIQVDNLCMCAIVRELNQKVIERVCACKLNYVMKAARAALAVVQVRNGKISRA